ncbi:phosphoglycerate mutase [Chiayiivirga flava]|uniref:Phosphoglycerate mutase n=1 Tax=Chiayiivirga flava TaxID=659595 RepID=A0A7W8D5F5_9GAMM|nr:phosphoglycerate mutase [Chiayiivirga flava]MBB5208255.1 hypothetical protein [Chiayiivirga flava]
MPLLLLPERRRLGGDPSSAPTLQRLLARGDSSTVPDGAAAQMHAAFDIVPRHLSPAALSREHDARDAALNAWLRADPGHVRADMGMGRLLACGDLGLTPDEVEALLKPLRPLFGDEGFPISAPHPGRWYLMLPREVQLPAFAAPDAVLGDDLYNHLPQGEPGRRWRRLLNEAQVILHNHPVNAARAAQGRVTVNTLWFWGGGTLPGSVRSAWTTLHSGDPVLRALAGLAAMSVADLDTGDGDRADAGVVEVGHIDAGTMLDLRDVRDRAALERRWLAPLFAQQRRGRLDTIELLFADGLRVRYAPAHRWRFWRRPPATPS